jgi:hypothetical protein
VLYQILCYVVGVEDKRTWLALRETTSECATNAGDNLRVVVKDTLNVNYDGEYALLQAL